MKVASWRSGAARVRITGASREGATYKEAVPELTWSSFPGLQGPPCGLAWGTKSNRGPPLPEKLSADTEQAIGSQRDHRNCFGRLKIQISRPE